MFSTKDPFGGLTGYKFDDGIPPSQWQNPSKAENVPADKIPVPRITSSAAHPGKKSNTTIPYTRVTSSASARLSGRPGHVTFVSKTQRAFAGCGTQRMSLMTSLDALNRILRAPRKDFTNTLPVDADVFSEWRGVSDLQEWRLDGVILGNPDMSNSNPTFDLIDGRSVNTTALNVAVAGPASVVDVFRSESKELHPQTELFIALVAKLVVSDSERYWTFSYVPITSENITDPTSSHMQDLLSTTVGAWRLGKVIDAKAVCGGGWPNSRNKDAASYERRVTVNVCIDWMDWRTLRAGFATLPNGYYNSINKTVGSVAISKLKSIKKSETANGGASPCVVLQWPTEYVGRSGDLKERKRDVPVTKPNRDLPGETEAEMKKWAEVRDENRWYNEHCKALEKRPPPADGSSSEPLGK